MVCIENLAVAGLRIVGWCLRHSPPLGRGLELGFISRSRTRTPKAIICEEVTDKRRAVSGIGGTASTGSSKKHNTELSALHVRRTCVGFKLAKMRVYEQAPKARRAGREEEHQGPRPRDGGLTVEFRNQSQVQLTAFCPFPISLLVLHNLWSNT